MLRYRLTARGMRETDDPPHPLEDASRRTTIQWIINERGCWICTSHNHRSGRYPSLHRNGRHVKLHRLIFESTYGPIPPGLSVCHSCDETHCINPEHLFLGTMKDNCEDREAKGRGRRQVGSQHPMSKLDEQKVVQIRQLFVAGSLQKELAEQFHVAPSTIWRVVTGANWKHTENQP